MVFIITGREKDMTVNNSEQEQIPKEMITLLSYISEMKRNHVIMAARIDKLEEDTELLKRKCKNAGII
jgi:hypothetical protein